MKVQTGIMAKRNPDGTFCNAMPIYDDIEEIKPSGLSEADEDACNDLAEVVARLFQTRMEAAKCT